MANARLMQGTLAQFDIEVALGDITKGPTITRYELHPAPGVKLIWAFVWNCGNQSFRRAEGCEVQGHGRSTSGINHEARVPMRSTGTDRSVRAMKAGNSAGAKGSGQAAVLRVQLATGGDL